MSKNLTEYSNAYYGLNETYELFSRSEDHPTLIDKELRSIIKDRVVLDAGCGTGKYLEKFHNITKELYGIDASFEQLELARKKNINAKLICSDLSSVDLASNTFDVIYCTWVLGTIVDIDKRNAVLSELKRLLKPNGVIILVENNIGGEFEEIRGRYPVIDTTKTYNDWIVTNDFKVLKEIDTYFQFKNNLEAYNVFNAIYGESVATKVSKKIEHKVIVYYLTI